MKYSDNPNDWYFFIFDNGDVKIILLSEDINILDDHLGSCNLPKKIRDLLSPYFFMDSELLESCFEINETCELSCSELTEILISLGFKESKDLADI